MWELVNESTLDQNSAYKYVLMCEYFSNSCVVAKSENKVVGFITGFIPPEKPDTVFVWQIGVHSSQRGNGLGSKLLLQLVEQQSAQISYVEATITPTNQASQALFKRLAKNLKTDCQISEFFSEDLFPGEQHEEEWLFRIGPFK